jgi:hypothetical protein
LDFYGPGQKEVVERTGKMAYMDIGLWLDQE